jgi:hypothetical protein
MTNRYNDQYPPVVFICRYHETVRKVALMGFDYVHLMGTTCRQAFFGEDISIHPAERFPWGRPQ